MSLIKGVKMHSDILTSYGNVIRKLRLNKKISQETLADLSDLHRTYISDIELGKRNVSLENIYKIAKALDIAISKVFIEIENNK